MLLKVVYEFFIKSYEHLKFQNSDIFKSDYPLGKRFKNLLTEKACQPSGNLGKLKKNRIEKMRFQEQKYEKYLKSKNDLKRLLGAFNKEL